MYEILEKLMQENGIRPFQISKATGIPSSVFTDWKKGRYTPKDDKRQKIADYFGVSLAYLDGKEQAPSPIYDVAAGEGAVNGTYATEYAKMDAELEEGYSWCTVHGNSMYPELHDGDKIKVKHMTETNKNDFAVVKIDGESSTVKFVEITDTGVWLRAINKEVYEDRFFSIREVITLPVKIIGKVVEVRRTY